MTIVNCDPSNAENIVPGIAAPVSPPLKMSEEKQNMESVEKEDKAAEATAPVVSEDAEESKVKAGEESPSKGNTSAVSKTETLVTPVSKTETPKKSKKDEEEEEEENDEDDEPMEGVEHLGVLDKPLVVEGKRQRSSVQRLAMTPVASPKPLPVYKGGKGVALGSVDFIAAQLDKRLAGDLKTMHRMLYGTLGKQSVIKKEIRAFNGFDFEENSDEFKKRVAMFNKLTTTELKVIKEVLGLHLHGTSVKDALITVLIQFLMLPHDHKRKVIKKRKSTKASGSRSHKTKRSKKSTDEVAEADGDGSSSDGSSDGESDAEAAESPAVEKATPTPKKTPKPKAVPKTPKSSKKAAKKTADDDDEAESKEPPKTPKSPKKAKASAPKKDDEANAIDQDKDSSDDEDEAANKPSEDEVVAMIKKLLDTFDLSQVSMKEMCKAVIEKFPDSDLEGRKTWLKEKIKAQLLG